MQSYFPCCLLQNGNMTLSFHLQELLNTTYSVSFLTDMDKRLMSVQFLFLMTPMIKLILICNQKSTPMNL